MKKRRIGHSFLCDATREGNGGERRGGAEEKKRRREEETKEEDERKKKVKLSFETFAFSLPVFFFFLVFVSSFSYKRV